MVSCSEWWLWNSVWCGWRCWFETGSPFHTGSRCRLSFIASLPQSVGQVSLQTGKGLQAERSEAKTSHLLTSNSKDFRFILQTSLTAAVVCGALSLHKYSVEEILWDPAIVHSHNRWPQLTRPAQASLFQQSVHAGSSSPLQDFVVWYSILPGDVDDAWEIPQVEDVQLSLLSGTRCPGHAAVQQCVHDASL